MKNIDFKELLFKWADKVVLAGCAVLGLLAIWGAFSTEVYNGDPQVIIGNAKKAKTLIENNKWPQEEADKFKLKPEEVPQTVVVNAIRRPIAPGTYEFETDFTTALTTESEPLKEPSWFPVETLIADWSEVIIPVVPQEDESDTETSGDTQIAKADTSSADSSIPEELRLTRSGAAAGAGAGSYESEYGSESSQYAPAGAGASEYDDYEGYSYENAYAVQGVEGEGKQFVAVRGIFPLRKQVQAIQKAVNAKSYWEARALLDMMNLEIERRSFRPGSDPEAAEWEAVDLRVAEDVLELATGIEPDAVPARITDPVITMPLPARIRGIYGSKATHPRIDNFVLSPEEMQRELAILSAMSDEIRERGDEAKLNAPREKGGFQSIVVGANASD